MPWKLKNATAVDIAPDWLQPYCAEFLRKLSEQGYAVVTLRSYDAAATLLCHEVSRRGLRSDQLVGATLTKARAAALGRNAKRKLGASNKLHAVTKAIYIGAIDI
jgi:precorrin-6B methylase 1